MHCVPPRCGHDISTREDRGARKSPWRHIIDALRDQVLRSGECHAPLHHLALTQYRYAALQARNGQVTHK